jgi:hypothetical protein
LIALFDVAWFAGRNTIFKTGFASSGLWDNVIYGKPEFSCAAISTLESISDKNILFAEGNTGSVNGAD